MKRALCIMLSVLLILTMFIGCGKDTPGKEEDTSRDNQQDGSDNKEANKSGTEVGDKKEDSNFNPTGLPIVNEKITLKMMGSSHPLQGDWEKMEVIEYLEEKTNIHMDINTVPDDGYIEKKNLAFAGGDLPDLFFRAKLTTQDEEQYGASQGLLIPLNDLINEYSPNLNKLLEEKPDAKKAITALDGKIYSLPYIYSTNTMANVRWINVKWLENVNMKMPETTDDFYEVLKAFRDKDPKKDGKGDQIPMTAADLPSVAHYLLPAFGIILGDGRYTIKEDKAVYTPLEDEYKEYILYVKKLYSEKLLDQEIFSHTLDQMYAKGKNNGVGVIPDSVNGMADPEEQEDYHVLAPLTSHVNKEKMTPFIPGVITGTFAITNKNKYPAETMRWVDLFYADHPDAVEGISGLSVDKGWEGKYWEFTNEEKTEERAIPQDENWDKHEHYTPFGAGGVPRYVNWWATKEGGSGTSALKIEGSEKNYFPYMKNNGYPEYVRFTDDETQTITVIETDIETYVEQMEAKFITGEEPIEKWDEFIKRIKDMGIEDALTVRQTALDRWNSIE